MAPRDSTMAMYLPRTFKAELCAPAIPGQTFTTKMTILQRIAPSHPRMLQSMLRRLQPWPIQQFALSRRPLLHMHHAALTPSKGHDRLKMDMLLLHLAHQSRLLRQPKQLNQPPPHRQLCRMEFSQRLGHHTTRIDNHNQALLGVQYHPSLMFPSWVPTSQLWREMSSLLSD